MARSSWLTFWVRFLNAAEQSRRYRAQAEAWHEAGRVDYAAELEQAAAAHDAQWDARARAHHDAR